MSIATRTQTDFTTQESTAYKTAIDGNCLVDGRIAGLFAVHEQSTPDMTVRVDAGVVPNVGGSHTEVAAQNTGTITAPSANPRNDIVYIDQSTGSADVATGAEAATPSDPAVPSGKIAVARIVLGTSTTSITNSLIIDLRAGLDWLGLGGLSMLNSVDTAQISDNAVTLAKLAGGTAGKYIGFNGSGDPAELTAPTISGMTTVSYTASDTFTMPSDAQGYALVSVRGAGGGGGGANTTAPLGNSGATGGTSSFGSLISATGGLGGGGGNTSTNGLGGAGGLGVGANISSSYGNNGLNGVDGLSGAGGDATNPPFITGSGGAAVESISNGNAGGIGAGGGGALASSTSEGAGGGAGGAAVGLYYVAPGANITVTIGAGGAGGSNSSANGGDGGSGKISVTYW